MVISARFTCATCAMNELSCSADAAATPGTANAATMAAPPNAAADRFLILVTIPPFSKHHGVGLPHVPQQKHRRTTETLVGWSRVRGTWKGDG
ncbi:hypothetical protein AB0I53_20310 [Saccharopolyspora sp. NPDC050389]|uniref:hypothetical protein n=1 Tax=Saccharopolyspora sp. NPDC050389 TaxID=3155516 RepID=UPI0034046893